jgi:hypothetical protein
VGSIRLKQDSAVVTGCYDRDGELTGTVTGNICGQSGPKTQGANTFILNVRDDGTLFGVRS